MEIKLQTKWAFLFFCLGAYVFAINGSEDTKERNSKVLEFFDELPTEITTRIRSFSPKKEKENLGSTSKLMRQHHEEILYDQIPKKAEDDAIYDVVTGRGLSERSVPKEITDQRSGEHYEEEYARARFIYTPWKLLWEAFLTHESVLPLIGGWSVIENQDLQFGGSIFLSLQNDERKIVSTIVSVPKTISSNQFEKLIAYLKKNEVEKVVLSDFQVFDKLVKIGKAIELLRKYEYNGLITYGNENETIFSQVFNEVGFRITNKEEEQLEFLLNSNRYYANLPINRTYYQESPFWTQKCLIDFCRVFWNDKTRPLIEYLLAHGADPNVRDDEGKTPLHYLCSLFYCDRDKARLLIEYFLAHGADPNVRDHGGKTPLHYLCENSYLKRHPARPFIEYLLEHGADPNVRDHKGKTPIDLIQSKKKRLEITEFISQLRSKGSE